MFKLIDYYKDGDEVFCCICGKKHIYMTYKTANTSNNTKNLLEWNEYVCVTYEGDKIACTDCANENDL